MIRIFNGFKRDAQLIISKVRDLEYEIGEHEFVVANARELPDDRNAYRLVGGVLVKTTVGDALPKVQQNMANIRATIDKLKVALASVNAKSAAWKRARKTQRGWSSRSGTRRPLGERRGPRRGVARPRCVRGDGATPRAVAATFNEPAAAGCRVRRAVDRRCAAG